jgi:ribosomal protein S18 acetylase RimI-like enzyme
MRKKPKFKIQRCDDKELIAKLHKRIFPLDVAYEEPSIDWLVTDSRGRPIGFCQLRDDASSTGFMARAGVLPRCQGYGLHRRMIIAREREARRRGLKLMTTYTRIHNIQSSANLEKHGYRLYLPPGCSDEKETLYWRKKL